MRPVSGLGVAMIAAFAAWSCSGGGSSSSSTTPTAPSTTTPATPANVTIQIVGSSGNTAYVPNPVPVAAGASVIFRNNDTTTHRIVMDDGSADAGNIAPGASTPAMRLRDGNFHCTIHPSMVGSINGATAPTPPPDTGGPTY